MKHTTSIAMLLILAVATSCKKENVIPIKTDIQLNAEIDKEASPELIVKMDDAQLYSIAERKKKVLQRIFAANPKITFTDLYPHNPGSDPDQQTANKGGSCADQYNSAITNCTIAWIGGTFWSVGIGVAVSLVTTPVGGIAVGGGSLMVTTLAYKACSQNAINVRDACNAQTVKK